MNGDWNRGWGRYPSAGKPSQPALIGWARGRASQPRPSEAEGAVIPLATRGGQSPFLSRSDRSCSVRQADRDNVRWRNSTMEIRPDRPPTRPTLEVRTVSQRVTRLAPSGARRRSIEEGYAVGTRKAPQGVGAPDTWGHRRGVSRLPRSCASPKAETARRSRSLRTAGSSRAETVLWKQGAVLIPSFVPAQGVPCLSTEALVTK